MALEQLNSPTVRPPTSLDLLDEEDEPGTGTALTAPTSTGVMSLTPPTAASPMVNGLPGPDVSGFATQQMASPSRYNSDVVQQGLSLINAETERSKTRGGADLDEFYSSRGLVGSSVESQGRTDFLSQLNHEKETRMFNLVREMANTYSQDVGTAGQLGLGARAQELQATGMNRDEAYRYALLEQSGGQFERSLGQRESEFSRQFGLSGQSLNLERDRLMQQAQLEGRALDISEATSQAEIGLRAQQLVQQAQTEGRTLDLAQARLVAENEQFDSNLAFQREQAASRLGLDAQALTQQREQYLGEFENAAADRLLRMGLQESDQAFQVEQNRLNRTLETRALDLQAAGLDAETSWRLADRLLEQQLENRALDLQSEGMTQEHAYRQAALELDRNSMAQQAQIANQQARLSEADIYLRALAAGAGDNLPTGTTLARPNAGDVGLPPPTPQLPPIDPSTGGLGPPGEVLLPGGLTGPSVPSTGTNIGTQPTVPQAVSDYPSVDPNTMISVGGQMISAAEYERLYGPLV